MGRILGIDYGKVRIGIAISDANRVLATGLCCLKNDKSFFISLKKALKPYEIEVIVVGLPLSLQGKSTQMTLEAREFSERLGQECGVPTLLWDERLTTAQVERFLKEGGVKRKRRAAVSDLLAASLILQSYIDYRKMME